MIVSAIDRPFHERAVILYKKIFSRYPSWSPDLPPAYTSQILPWNAQHVGISGQWGLVDAPALGLCDTASFEAFDQSRMPHSRHESEYTTVGLSGGATCLWVINKEWKMRYDQTFKAWDE